MRLAGRHQPRAALLEEPEVERALQVANEPAHRRLGYADHLRRGAHASRQHRRAEGLELPWIEHDVAPRDITIMREIGGGLQFKANYPAATISFSQGVSQ